MRESRDLRECERMLDVGRWQKMMQRERERERAETDKRDECSLRAIILHKVIYTRQ